MSQDKQENPEQLQEKFKKLQTYQDKLVILRKNFAALIEVPSSLESFGPLSDEELTVKSQKQLSKFIKQRSELAILREKVASLIDASSSSDEHLTVESQKELEEIKKYQNELNDVKEEIDSLIDAAINASTSLESANYPSEEYLMVRLQKEFKDREKLQTYQDMMAILRENTAALIDASSSLKFVGYLPDEHLTICSPRQVHQQLDRMNVPASAEISHRASAKEFRRWIGESLSHLDMTKQIYISAVELGTLPWAEVDIIDAKKGIYPFWRSLDLREFALLSYDQKFVAFFRDQEDSYDVVICSAQRIAETDKLIHLLA